MAAHDRLFFRGKRAGLEQYLVASAIFPMSCRKAPRAIILISVDATPMARASAMVYAVTRLECPSVSESFRSSASPSASSVMSYDCSISSIA
jgi:hypothetical protein